MENLEKPNNAAEDEAAIADFESESGFVPLGESEEQAREKESFIGRTAKYCRMVHGKLLCRIGEHEYEEVGSEIFHGGRDKKVNLRCKRKRCPEPVAWTNWRMDDESGEYKKMPF